jgi:hypothetical protein
MKTTAVCAAIAAVGLTALAWGGGPDREALAKKQAALSAEYNLAKDAKFYFVFNVAGKTLELRVRGMVLRTWPLQAMRFWGRPDFVGTVELTKRTTLKAPERIVIKPGESELIAPAPTAKPAAGAAAADYDLEALELRDMPKRFSLDFDNGLHVTVEGKSGGSTGLIGSMKEAWSWYVRLPLRHLFGASRGPGQSELEIVFSDEKDAQSVYWHLFDGIKGIIL